MKIKLLFLFPALLMCVANSWAQKLYKSNAHASLYLNALSLDEQPVKRDVQQIFSKHQTVNVIDFSETQIALPPASYMQGIQPRLKKGEFFEITDRATMSTIVQQQPRALTMIIPFDGNKITIDLVKTDIFGDGFTVESDRRPSGETVKLGAYYKGIVRGNESVVSLSFFSSHVEGFISIAGKPAIEFGRMKNSSTDNVHIIYSNDNLLYQRPFICSAPEGSISEYLNQMKSVQKMSLQQQARAGIKCVTNFWETRYDLYQLYGNNVQAVCDFITTVFNSFATLYANENIGMKLYGAKIWTKEDPYPVSDDATVLVDFSVNRRLFGLDLGMLLSASGWGGIAFLGSLCETDDFARHSFCGALTDTVARLPQWSWPAMVTTHEVGHNLGSPHTHDCAWNGNNTAIDGCGPKAGYGGWGECPVGPLPFRGGTIMSYCHLLPKVGVNFRLGFGPQPGDLIRGAVHSCITKTCKCPEVIGDAADFITFITKHADKSTSPGRKLEFAIGLKATAVCGEDIKQHYSVTDSLPGNVTYISSDGTYNSSNRTVTFNNIGMSGGDSITYHIKVKVNDNTAFPDSVYLDDPTNSPIISDKWKTKNGKHLKWSSNDSVFSGYYYYSNDDTVKDAESLITAQQYLIPGNTTTFSFLHNLFSHDFMNGGVVEITADGGKTWQDLGPYMSGAVYNATITGNSVLHGRKTFSGYGISGTTNIDLSSFAGKKIKIRFRYATSDSSSATPNSTGWFITYIVLSASANITNTAKLFNRKNELKGLSTVVTKIKGKNVTTDFVAAKYNETEALLTWQKPGEINGTYQVERSTDNGVTFRAIGIVKTAGNNSNTQSYSFKDAAPAEGFNLYRIHHLSSNKSVDYTDIKTLTFDNLKAVQVYPNPAKDKIKIYIPGNNKIARLQLMNVLGKQIKTYTIVGQYAELKLPPLPQGAYYLNVIRNGTTTKHIIIIE